MKILKNFPHNEKLLKERYKIILNNISRQLKKGHELCDRIIWEIGNEDHFVYEPETYAIIVEKYVNLIKKLYPNDEIIVEMANSYFGSKTKYNYNKKLISILSQKKLLDKIKYFAPHFYPERTNIIDSQSKLKNKIINSDPLKFENDMVNFFQQTIIPHFFTLRVLFLKRHITIKIIQLSYMDY